MGEWIFKMYINGEENTLQGGFNCMINCIIYRCAPSKNYTTAAWIYQGRHHRRFLPRRYSETLKITSVNFGKYVSLENRENLVKHVEHIWDIFHTILQNTSLPLSHPPPHVNTLLLTQTLLLSFSFFKNLPLFFFFTLSGLPSHFPPNPYWDSSVHPNHGCLQALRDTRAPFQSARPCHHAAIGEHHTKGGDPRWTAPPPHQLKHRKLFQKILGN